MLSQLRSRTPTQKLQSWRVFLHTAGALEHGKRNKQGPWGQFCLVSTRETEEPHKPACRSQSGNVVGEETRGQKSKWAWQEKKLLSVVGLLKQHINIYFNIIIILYEDYFETRQLEIECLLNPITPVKLSILAWIMCSLPWYWWQIYHRNC